MGMHRHSSYSAVSRYPGAFVPARCGADDYWHQLLLRGLSIGLQEEPDEVGRRSGSLLV